VEAKEIGKIKRICNNPKVQFSPCTLRGKVVDQQLKAWRASWLQAKRRKSKETLDANTDGKFARASSSEGLGQKKEYVAIVPIERNQ